MDVTKKKTIMNTEKKMGTVEPIYNDGDLHIKDDAIAFIYGAIKKYGNDEELYDELRGYIGNMLYDE